jgi:hypothetical protein
MKAFGRPADGGGRVSLVGLVWALWLASAAFISPASAACKQFPPRWTEQICPNGQVT